MKTAAALKKKLQSGSRWRVSKESALRFAEGLIGFSECKNFSLTGNDDIAPFELLQCIDKPEVGFFVIDPETVIREYDQIIPERDWETIGVRDVDERAAFVICVIGRTASDSTVNFQAPLIVNTRKKIGKQVILSDCGMSARQPLL
jgi:flagellar assembly factor FliW